jgi:hypothetical protein
MATIKRNPTDETNASPPHWPPFNLGKTFDGGPGDDIFYGSNYDDTINGNDGDDTLVGHGGSDTITGMDGEDTIEGGSGDDFLYGVDDDDTINGGDGEDLINGGGENDTLNGGNNNDTIHGGSGHDMIKGGQGDDTLYGGEDFDELWGGSGADTFTYLSTHASISSYTSDIIWDFERGLDQVDLRELAGHATNHHLFLDDHDGIPNEAGEIMISAFPPLAGTALQIDFQGDGHVDFAILFFGLAYDAANPLDADDLLLT